MDARTCAGSGRSRRSSGRARAGGRGRRTCSRRRRPAATASRSRRQRRRRRRLAGPGMTPCRSPWSNRSRSQETDAWSIRRCRMRSIGRIEPRAAAAARARLVARGSTMGLGCWQTCGVDVVGRVAGRPEAGIKGGGGAGARCGVLWQSSSHISRSCGSCPLLSSSSCHGR